MKLGAAAPVLAFALLFAGCGSSKSTESTTATTAAVETQESETADVLTVSSEATCAQLMGSDSDGPIFDGVDFVMTLTSHEGIDDADVTSAREVAEKIRPIADRAGPELKPSLEAFLEPAEALVQAADGDGQYDQNFDDWKASSTELLTKCASSSIIGSGGPAEELVISEEATCTQLVGPNEDGPLLRGVETVAGVGQGKADAEQAQEIIDELAPIEEHAIAELKPYLRAFVSPLEDIVAASKGQLSEDWEGDLDEWKAVGTELLTRCS